jgi:TRAP-type transport system periplasmic protein
LGEFEFIFPFGPTDPVIMTKAFRRMHEEFPEFARDEAKEKAVWIAFAGGSEYKFLSKKPIRTIDDFKGEKVSLIGRWLSKWLPPGASPVVRPGQERYDLLRSGVVNIDLLPIDLHHAFKTHEQIKYFSNIKIFTPCFATVLMSLDTLSKFPPEVQKILIEAGKETELRHSQTVVPPYVDKILQDWKARGIQFIDFAKADEQKWINGLEDIPAIWAAELQAKGYPAFKMVERWQAITSELGFKWARKWGIQK